MLQQVTVSGSVGKFLVRPNSGQATLRGVVLTPSGANATIKIRDGKQGTSGEVVLFARATSANGSLFMEVCHKFTKGLHVTVIGSNAEAYLDIT